MTLSGWGGRRSPYDEPHRSPHDYPNHYDMFGHCEVISVDANAFNHVVIEQLLCSCGYQVSVCATLGDAMALFLEREYLPDLLLFDCDNSEGNEDVNAIRAIRCVFPESSLPLIMLSDNTNEHSVVQGLEAGCNDYIRKPFERKELLARIGTALRLTHMSRIEAQTCSQKALLRSMLPEHVIDRLQAGETNICDQHPEVTILFSDIVGYTSMAGLIPTEELVVILNEMFSKFDTLTDQYQVYKVETIGDAYMAVAGHDDCPCMHAERMAEMAIAMSEAARGIARPGGGHLEIRIGIHTGPAFSGVVGHKMPRFCFFGDTVNLASRMESTGVPGKVCVSASTKSLLSADKWHFEDRGGIEMKGKGLMESYIIKLRDPNSDGQTPEASTLP